MAAIRGRIWRARLFIERVRRIARILWRPPEIELELDHAGEIRALHLLVAYLLAETVRLGRKGADNRLAHVDALERSTMTAIEGDLISVVNMPSSWKDDDMDEMFLEEIVRERATASAKRLFAKARGELGASL